MEVSQKVKHMIQQFHLFHFCVYIQKESKAGSQGDICPPIFITVLHTIAKRWEQLKYPSMDEQINKMWSSYAKD